LTCHNFEKLVGGRKKVLRISLVFGWSFFGLTSALFFILFLSFEQSSHCRNNAMHTPMLKKKKTYVQKEKAERANPKQVYLQSK
jgi:hypothetical protein